MTSRSLFFLLFSFVLASCSTNTKTIAQKGETILKGGKFHELSWKDNLVFERISWYHELTMLFDAQIAKIDSNSPFYNWFTDGEKRLLAPCQDTRLAMAFYHDSKKISERMFKDEWEKSGYDSIAVPGFKKNISVHSDFEALNLQRYGVFILCRKGLSNNEGTISVNFPGFNTEFFNVK